MNITNIVIPWRFNRSSIFFIISCAASARSILRSKYNFFFLLSECVKLMYKCIWVISIFRVPIDRFQSTIRIVVHLSRHLDQAQWPKSVHSPICSIKSDQDHWNKFISKIIWITSEKQRKRKTKHKRRYKHTNTIVLSAVSPWTFAILYRLMCCFWCFVLFCFVIIILMIVVNLPWCCCLFWSRFPILIDTAANGIYVY